MHRATRCLSTSCRLFARGKKGGRRDDGSFLLSRQFPKVTGNPEFDGLNKYELDFLETAEWTKSLLLKMKNELPGIAQQQGRQPKEAFNATERGYLCFQTTQVETFDCTSMPQIEKKAQVKLFVSVGRVSPPLSPEERHRLLLLAGELYDPATDTIQLKSSKMPHQAQNKRYLADMWSTLLETARSGEDISLEIPVDLRHAKPKEIGFDFPKEWNVEGCNS